MVSFRSLTGGLAATAALLLLPVGPGAGPVAAAQVTTADTITCVLCHPEEQQPIDPRPFRHVAHRDLFCGECHGTGAEHRFPRTWDPVDCAACHHSRPSGIECADCHRPDRYARPRVAVATMSTSVWPGPQLRRLRFEHVVHDSVGCTSCHTSGLLMPTIECASCHESHHRPEADCSQCHISPPTEAHPLEAHVTCAGSGCHSVEAVSVRPMLSRTSCLICHREMSEHQPGRECAVCHIHPDTSRVIIGPGGSPGRHPDGR